MKKKVLSLFLLLAVVASALPLFSLGAGAAALPAESAYDDLYVKDGLVFSADFFKTNSIWGEEITLTELGSKANNSFKQFVRYQMREDMVLHVPQKDGLPTTVTLGEGYLQIDPTSIDSTYGSLTVTPLILQNALDSAQSGATLQLVSSLGAVNNGHAIMLAGVRLNFADTTKASNLLPYSGGNGAKVNALWEGWVSELKLTSPAAHTAEDLSDAFALPFAENGTYQAPFTLTMEVKRELGDWLDADEDGLFDAAPTRVYSHGTVGIWADGEAVFKTTAFPFAYNVTAAKVEQVGEKYKVSETALSSRHGDNAFYFGYAKSTDMRIYAIRIYSRNLTEDEMALNHMADLMKWYRLDPTLYAALSADARLILAKQYRAVGFDETDVSALSAALSADITDVMYAFLVTDNAPAAFIEIVKENYLNTAALESLPVDQRESVYEVVIGAPVGTTKDAYQTLMDEAVMDAIEVHYGEYFREQSGTYLDIYAKQDNLILWVDFFDAKPEDTPVYQTTSYPDWVEKYQAVYTKQNEAKAALTAATNAYNAVKDDAGKSEEEKAAAKKAMDDAQEALNAINATLSADLESAKNNRTEVSHESTWQAMVDKYVHRGASYLKALDLKDKNYPHTNVREYGQGRLICSLNNSLTVNTPGNDSDVTYQFVATPTGTSGSLQLNGFRTGYAIRQGGEYLFEYISYYGYGASGTSLIENALLYNRPTERISFGSTTGLDLTITLDKSVGADTGHYYTYDEVYEGNRLVKIENIREVETAAEAKSAKITYAGRMDINVYANGVLSHQGLDLSYQNGDIGSVGNGGGNEFFAIRTYNCVLTEEDILQNHFADLAGYYDLDLTLYFGLTEEDRKTVHEALADLRLGGSFETAERAYRDVVDPFYYALESESEAGESFMSVAKAQMLDVTNLAPLSPSARERVYTLLSDVKETWHYALLQGRLEEAVATVLSENYAESMIASVATFMGYQVTEFGETGFRALYRVDTDLIETLREKGVTVQILLMEKNHGEVAGAPADLTPSLSGGLILPVRGDGIKTFYIYKADGTSSKYVFEENGETYFSVPVMTDDYGTYIQNTAYVGLSSEAEGDLLWQVPQVKKNSALGAVQSLGSLSLYAKETLNWSIENIQKVTNAIHQASDMIFYVGDASVSKYLLVETSANAAAVAEFNDLIEDATGIRLTVVKEELLKGNEAYLLRVGAADTVYDDPDCYGITVGEGVFYVWYNSAENSDLAFDYLESILTASAAEGKCVLPIGCELVKKHR